MTDQDVDEIRQNVRRRLDGRPVSMHAGQRALDPACRIERIAGVIDHTLLRADAAAEAVESVCRQAKQWQTASVCVNPQWVPMASRVLAGSNVAVCSVVGFPFGANLSEIKAQEAMLAVQQGAGEIDMVMALGAFRSGWWQEVYDDVALVRAKIGNAILKVIVETGLWSPDQIVAAAIIAANAGADYVKTSTGYLGAGATVEAVQLLRSAVGPDLGVKASGGIHTAAQAWELIDAGASRIGSSQTERILDQAPATS